MTDEVLEQEWEKLLAKLSAQFGDLDVQGVLFLIGVQELGKGYQQFKKDEKIGVMHIAICTLLEPFGYYTFTGRDADGWPHWELNQSLPPLKPAQQHLLMRKSIIDYFNQDG